MNTKYTSLIAGVSAVCMLCGCAQTAAQAGSALTQSTSASVSQAEELNAVERVVDIATTQYFTEEAVAASDIETILLAGINAPSAMNGQPWHFSVITDAAVLQQISEDMSGGFGGGMPPAGVSIPEGAGPESSGMTPPEGMVPPEGFEGAPDGGMPAPPAGAVDGGSGSVSKAGLTDAPLAIVISCADGSELDAGLACQNMSVTAQLLGYGTKIISSPTMALNGAKQAEYRELLGIPENQSAAAILLVGQEDTSIDESVDGYTGATARNPLEDMVTYVEG